MGTAERIRNCRVRAGKSAQQIAAELGLNEAWYRDLESKDDELTSTLTLFQAMQLASLLGVRLEELLTETVPSSSKIALWDLPSMMKDHIAREGISIEEFENRVGCELQEFLQSPVKVAAEIPIMLLRDIAAPLGIHWLSLVPEQDTR
jgi:transcriptional regulator with XRE-family HTH domain